MKKLKFLQICLLLFVVAAVCAECGRADVTGGAASTVRTRRRGHGRAGHGSVTGASHPAGPGWQGLLGCLHLVLYPRAAQT